METAANILIVGGVLNLAYSFVTGFLMASGTLPVRVDGRHDSTGRHAATMSPWS